MFPIRFSVAGNVSNSSMCSLYRIAFLPFSERCTLQLVTVIVVGWVGTIFVSIGEERGIYI